MRKQRESAVPIPGFKKTAGSSSDGADRAESDIVRLASLDILRVLAATSVVFYHLAYGVKVEAGLVSSIAKYGYLGVDLFFMISGFVILWSAQGRTIREFAVSRFCRLYPMFWICLGLTLLALWLAGGIPPDLWAVLANMTMVAGYLDQPYIDAVYWTLQVELKFYLIVGVLIIFRGMRHIEAVLICWLAVCVADALFEIHGVLKALIIAPYGPLFIAGATFCLIRFRGLTVLRGAVVFVCLMISIPVAYTQSASYLFGRPSGVSSILIVLIFAAMGAVAMGWFKLRAKPVILLVSSVTYPLYLLHNQIGRQLLDSFGLWLTVLSVFLLAFLTVKIDRPFSGWLKARLG